MAEMKTLTIGGITYEVADEIARSAAAAAQNIANGKAAASHNHAASEITSGTLSSDRLPTVPVANGGTGATTAAAARTNLGITPENIGAATVAEVNQLKTSVSEGKALIAAAVTDKGVETAADASFATMASNIGSIKSGSSYAGTKAHSKTFEILMGWYIIPTVFNSLQ